MNREQRYWHARALQSWYKKLVLQLVAGFVLALVIAWFLGYEINPF